MVTPEATTKGRALVVDSVPPRVFATTSLFGQLAADLQASEEMVPASKLPGLRVQPARVAKVGE